MSRLVRAVAVALAALAAGTAEAGVFVLTQPDGTRKIVNIPGSSAARVPRGSLLRRDELWPRVQETAKSFGVDPTLVDLVIRMESGYNPSAVSPKGAQGVMQLMPDTASLYGVRNTFDPEQNIRGGVRYLKDLLERFGSNVTYALAAYNAGPEAVERHGGIPPYRETRNYVQSILGAYGGRAGGSGGVLSGGFGKPTHTRQPVLLVERGGSAVISNSRHPGEATIDRRLSLR
ncbi:MAG: lytic transglycosylase domain-containing protein [Acidobacteriota bacterium]